LKAAVALKLTSTTANVFAQGGSQLHEKYAISFQPATRADLNPVTFTLHRK
jgi:hypothetical protein